MGTLVNEVLKSYPYLKSLKPYIYYPLDCLKERNGALYRAIHENKYKPLGKVLSLVKEYSKANYCFYQFDHWPDMDGYSYSESVEADVYGLFTVLSDEANNITMQIAAGVPIVTVAGRAGHARTRMTTDIYSHFLKTADRSAAQKLEEIFE